jgi:hypothetical protein
LNLSSENLVSRFDFECILYHYNVAGTSYSKCVADPNWELPALKTKVPAVGQSVHVDSP